MNFVSFDIWEMCKDVFGYFRKKKGINRTGETTLLKRYQLAKLKLVPEELQSLMAQISSERQFAFFWKDGSQIYPLDIESIYMRLTESRSIRAEIVATLFNVLRSIRNDEVLINIDLTSICNDKTDSGFSLDSWEYCLPKYELEMSSSTSVATHQRPFPRNGIPHEFIEAWTVMNAIGKRILYETYLSPYRIVLSYFNGKSMTITCRKTSKYQIIPIIHTPIVEKDPNERYVFYGSQDHEPSSETHPHWIIHNQLMHMFPGESSAIIHCHPIILLRWLDTKKDHSLYLTNDKILDHQLFGSDALGNDLSSGLIDKRSAIVLGHGVWTIGRTFSHAYDKFLSLMTDIKSYLG